MTSVFIYGVQGGTCTVCHEQMRVSMLSDMSCFWALGRLILLVVVNCVTDCRRR